MSQAGILNIAGGGGGGSPIFTITGNSGGPIPATANNINIIGVGGVNLSGNAGTSTLTVTSGDNILSGTATTSDGAGQTQVLNVNIPVPNNSAISIRVNLVGMDTTNFISVGGEILATATNKAGTVSFDGLPDETLNKNPALNAASFTAVVSGTNLQVQVIGVAGRTMNWKGIIDTVGVT